MESYNECIDLMSVLESQNQNLTLKSSTLDTSFYK